MPLVTAKPISAAEYLLFEETAVERHEFVDGTILAMAGENRLHNRLARRFALLLEPIADQKNCEVIFKTVKVRTKETRYRYPDFAVSCNSGADPKYFENPCLIVEVLSSSIEHTDFGKKLDEYTRLPSLQRYVLVASNSRFVVVYKRDGQRWLMESLDGTGEFDIPCLDANVSLDEIYAGVNFEA